MKRLSTLAIATLFALLVLPAAVIAQPSGHGVRPVDQRDRAEVHFGQVTVDVLWGSGIAAAVDVAPADGVVDRLYVLQKAAHAPAELPLQFTSARVLAHESSVIITGSGSERGVVLLLEREDRLPRQMELIEGEMQGVRDKRGATAPAPYVYTGFGLAERTESWAGDPFELLATEPRVMDKSGCDAGGTGSTGCSISCGKSSCSTSCSSGFYACCDCGVFTGADCQCVSTGGGSGSGGPGGAGGGAGDECNTTHYCPSSCMSCSPYAGGDDETPEATGS